MLKRIEKNNDVKVLASYVGLLKHGNAWTIKDDILRLRDKTAARYAAVFLQISGY